MLRTHVPFCYDHMFDFSQVSMETLMTLTEQDFIEMGIESLGLRQICIGVSFCFVW